MKDGVPLHRWVDGGQPRLEVVALPYLDRAPHDLHVLLRHRLLRQPHGFEGFTAVQVAHRINDHAVLETEYVKGALLRYHASLRASPHLGGREHAVTTFNDLNGREPDLIKQFAEPLEVACDSLSTMVGGGVRNLGNLVQNALRVPQREPRLVGEA